MTAYLPPHGPSLTDWQRQAAAAVNPALQLLSVMTTPVTVAKLPAVGNAGTRACVSDATATTFASTVVGGGANVVPVFDNGTNWIIG